MKRALQSLVRTQNLWSAHPRHLIQATCFSSHAAKVFELGLFLRFMHSVLGGCALYVCIWGGDLLSLRWLLNLAHRLCMWFDWMWTVEDKWMNLDVYVMY